MMLRQTISRPAVRATPAAPRAAVRVVRCRAQPEKALQDALKEAEDCKTAGECAAAWDNVEEISAAISHKKAADSAGAVSDPLEKYCGDNPDADECRVYDD